MKKLLLVPFVVVLFSCNSTKNSVVTENKKEQSNLYEILNESEYQGKDTKSFEIIKDNAGLTKLYESVNDPQIPKVDFTKSRIVALFLGQKNSGGYSIKVKDVTESNNIITVKIIESSPKPGENATMALTNPFTILKINSTKEIIFK